MATYSLEDLTDFIMQLFDKENEDEIWQMWLHKEYKDSYKTFKKKYYQKMHKKKQKPLSADEEKEIIEKNMQFIKPVNKGGEAD